MIAPLPRRLITLALAALPWLPVAHAQAPEVAGAASASAQRLTVQRDTLWNIAATLVPGREPSRPQVMVAILRANPDAFVLGNMHRLRRGVSLVIPSLEAMKAEPVFKAAALVDAHLAAAGELRPVAALEPLPGVAAPRLPPVAPVVPVAPVAPVTPVPPVVRAASAVVTAPVAVPAASAPVPAPASAPASIPATELPVPAPASAPVVSAAPSAAAGAASAVVDRSTPAAAATESIETRWLPYTMLVLLVGAAVALWMRRRPVKNDAQPSSFVDEQGVQRRRRPKVLDVSQAAADMVRTVETLQPTVQLVSGGAAAPVPASTTDLRQQAALKLDLARACMEVGRKDSARALLLAVSLEGSVDQQADAAELMARLG
jgi:FimV-like protein